MPRTSLLPTFRRSTFRAPDPEAAARFDVALPGANTDDERQPAAELAELAELRSESIETALVEQRLLVEDRLMAEVAADRDAAQRRNATDLASAPRPEVARTSFVVRTVEERTLEERTLEERTVEGRAAHPRHRADRVGNRRPTSGSRRPLLVG